MKKDYNTVVEVSLLKEKNYLLDLIAKATSKNIYIDSVKAKEQDQGTIYEMTVRVKDKEELESFMESLQNFGFIKGVNRR